VLLDRLQYDEEAADYYLDRCRALSTDRILFITSKGFIGTGSPATSIGDNVADMANVSMPLILRPDGDSQYKLIGPAFIYPSAYPDAPDGYSRGLDEIFLS
jgi:hypothetical protein